MNGLLKSLVHGTKYAEMQICSSISLFLNYHDLKEKYLHEQSTVYSYCLELESKSRLKTQKINKKMSVVGTCKKNSLLFPLVSYCLRNFDIDENKIHFFYRLLNNGLLFDCKLYNRQKKTKSSVVEYVQDGMLCIGRIEVFVKICTCTYTKDSSNCNVNDCKYYAIINKYEYKPAFECDLMHESTSFIYLCTNTNLDVRSAVPVGNVQQVLFEIVVDQCTYVIKPVNSIAKA